MSVNTKNISVKLNSSESKDVEEFLVERYESLTFKLDLLNSVGKWTYASVLLVGAVIFSTNKNLDIKPQYFFIYFTLAFLVYEMLIVTTMSRRYGLEEKISKLKRQIIKIQMEKEFQHDEFLMNKFESFYITYNFLTRGKEGFFKRVFSMEVVIYSLFFWIFVIISWRF